MKQEIIEEMAKELKEEKLYALINKTSYIRSAENLYELGYRKIPENAVVILDEEMEEFAEKLAKSPQMQKVMNGLIKAWKKETAEKFAEMAKKWNDEASLGGWVEVELAVINNAIDEIAKELTEERV